MTEPSNQPRNAGPGELRRPDPRRTVGERVRDWIEWFGLSRLIVTAVSVVAVGVGGAWLVRTPATPVEASLPRADTVSSSTSVTDPTEAAPSGTTSAVAPPDLTSAPSSPPDLVVHVAGAVVAPGVYRLPAGSRVLDAILAAGGATAEADGDAVNQAQVLLDGQRLYLPTRADEVPVAAGVSGGSVESGGGASGVEAPAAPVDLNAATEAELEALPGVGPATAAAIVAHRAQHGPFAAVDDLADVRGIGPAKLEALRSQVRV